MAVDKGTYFKPHTSKNGGVGSTIINIGTQSNYNADTLNVTDINAQNASISNIKADNIDASNINSDVIKSNTVKADKGNIYNLTSNEINAETVNATSGNIKKLKTTEADIDSIVNKELKSDTIVTDYLTVNKTAHFFELIIDKIRSVQGTQINTAANCILDYVEEKEASQAQGLPQRYRCYWRKTDADGRSTTNDWLTGDQAICQSFNAGQQNKYYWRYVCATSNDFPSALCYVNLNPDYPDYSGANKVNTGNSNRIHFMGTYFFEYESPSGSVTIQDNDQDPGFIIEAGGGSTYDSRYWRNITSLTDTLKITPTENFLSNGAFKFRTNRPIKLNLSVIYDDGSADVHMPDESVNHGYEVQYSFSTSSSKNVSYFLITPALIDKWDECHWIDLDLNDCDTGSDIPEIGDNVAQLGYRWDTLTTPTQTDIDRASAIIIAAYATPDSGITPPSYAQYQNIGTLYSAANRYNLADNRKTFFDARGGTVIGNFKVDTGGGTNVNLDDYIRSLTDVNPANLKIQTNWLNTSLNLIVLQTDTDPISQDQYIDSLNNWPASVQLVMTLNNLDVYDWSKYVYLHMNVMGDEYDLLNFTAPSSPSGIYISSVIIPPAAAMRPISITFDFPQGSTQVIASSSLSINGRIIDDSDPNNPQTYDVHYSVPVTGVGTVEGADAELYLLKKIEESARVTCPTPSSSSVSISGTLTTDLNYGIFHVIGDSVTTIDPITGMTLDLTIYLSDNSSSVQTIAYDTLSHMYTYHHGVLDYLNSPNPVPVKYKVELKLDGSVIDSSLVYVDLGARSVLNVNDTMLSFINTANTNIGRVDIKADNISARLIDIVDDMAQTGIDITHGTIELRGDNVTFTNSAGTVSGKIRIDPTTGTLYAENATLSGLFTSENAQTLYKILIDCLNGGATFYSPRDVTYNSSTGQWETASGTSQVKTAEINWDIDESANTTTGALTLYSGTDQNKKLHANSKSIQIINNNAYGSSITLNENGASLAYYGGETYYNSWDNITTQKLSIIKTSDYNPLPVQFTPNLDHSMIIVNHSGTTAFTIWLPDPATCGGKVYYIKNLRAAQLTLTTLGGNSKVIMSDDDLGNSHSLNVSNKSIIIASDGGNDWIMFSNSY